MKGKGWQKAIQDGEIAKTVGQSCSPEQLKIRLKDISGGIRVTAFLNGIGWRGTQSADSGSRAKPETNDPSGAVRCARIEFTGDAKTDYHIYCRVHAANGGWLGWSKNGEKPARLCWKLYLVCF